MRLISTVATGLVLGSAAAAQGGFPPPLADDIVTVPVADAPGVSISYRETHICEERSRAWAGYVHMSSNYTQDVQGDEPYDASMFFWYFEARNNPQEAPTTIYLAGGAGQSSVWGAASDGGPCYVGADGNSTYNNEWSMNTNVNMLYLDQPVGTGFSYDALINSTFNALFLGGTTLLSLEDTGIVPFEAYNGDGTRRQQHLPVWHVSIAGCCQDCQYFSRCSADAVAFHSGLGVHLSRVDHMQQGVFDLGSVSRCGEWERRLTFVLQAIAMEAIGFPRRVLTSSPRIPRSGRETCKARSLTLT